MTVSKYYTPSGRLIQREYKGRAVEEYYLENGPDSLDAAGDSSIVKPVYYTSSGREVYGGGGIKPDIKIEYKNAYKSRRMVREFIEKRIFFEAASIISRKHFAWKKNFSKFKAHFHINRRQLQKLKDIAKAEKINFSDREFDMDSAYLKSRLKAEIARQLWGMDKFYRMILENDNQFKKSFEYFPEADKLLVLDSAEG